MTGASTRPPLSLAQRTSTGRLEGRPRASARIPFQRSGRPAAARLVGQRRYLLSHGRRSHDCAVSVGFRGPASLAGDDAGLPRRAPTAQQGDALPGRPADGGRDRRRDAPRRRGPPRLACASDDRRAVARRPAHPGGARARRARSRPAARIGSCSQRQGRAATRGRHGRVGLGAPPALAQRTGRNTVFEPVASSIAHSFPTWSTT
jgi:hypothetical protein